MTGPRNDLDLRPHGTAAAYRRHYRRGEKACWTCKQGESVRRAESRERTAYDNARRERYAAARAAGLSVREALAARSPGRLEQALAGVS